ncbi:MAG: hypothetical protein UR89_C0004G0016 [Candidatus Roizmanbacteria bacterium GW2011_GWA2_35_8]|uniref:Uncharacterized protein n=1 Tax=Candidatus Roizmanbacteria bacterium GW2011_GWA2_35_8 TaxID=1618479 RepID=A0A0G0G684_9BACT|nr:MAG: hypothetical protein UR89_C0004G0016 [Candidatus Roizmanbacteria bacterium GW2011_GWA2_35_8]
MEKINHREIRQAWIKSTKSESEYRLYHIEKRKKEIIDLHKQNQIPILETAELLFNIFTLLNLLAHIDLRNDKYIKEKDIISWLEQITLWPLEVVEAFWYCLRNPNMHTGRNSIHSDYDRKSSIKKYKKYTLHADFLQDLNFDPKLFQPDKFKPTEREDGYLSSVDPAGSNVLNVFFYYPGLIRKLHIAVNTTIKNIQNANNISLSKLKKVNKKILPLYYVG